MALETASESFDHVGAGSAGCACAARLAEEPEGTICGLEAGPKNDALRLRGPFGPIRAIGHPRLDRRRRTVPQAHASGRAVAVSRGKALGGSGSIDSMIRFRGRADQCTRRGPGRRWQELRPASEAVEARAKPARLPWGHPPAERFGRAFGGTDPAAPPTPERESAGVGHVAMRRGARHSAADAFRRPAQRPGRVTARTEAKAARVLLRGRRATGAPRRSARPIAARGGAILAAGAIESPRVPMRSGIGPGPVLQAAGTRVAIDSAGAGETLHDRPGFGLQHAGGMIARATSERIAA